MLELSKNNEKQDGAASESSSSRPGIVKGWKDLDLTTSIAMRYLSVRMCVHTSVRPQTQIHLSNQSPFSTINILINQLYSSLAQLIATFKTFCLVFFKASLSNISISTRKKIFLQRIFNG